jgi:TPR repeat protein
MDLSNYSSLETLGDYCFWRGYYENNNEDYYKKAIEYYEKAYQSKCYDALFGLGNIYEFGLGVEKDISTAMECYKGAANHNVPGATKKFVYLVDKESKWAENIDWLIEKSNEENDEACYELACLAYECSKDPTHRNLEPFKDKNRNDLINLYVKLLERAETLGNIEAGLNLAQCLEVDFLKKHISDSSFETYNTRLIRSAYMDNNAKAQLMLAKSYSNDKINPNGIKAPLENKVVSASFYAIAAINGNAEAQYYFGKCCELGYGVPKNEDKANKWYNKTDFVEPNKFIKFLEELF